MAEGTSPTKAELTILRRKVSFAQTMLDRMKEKNRRAEKAQEAKTLTLQAELARMEVEYDEAQRDPKAPHYEGTVFLSGEGNA